MKPTIRTTSGIYFDFVNPTLEMVNLSDICNSLSNICRFGGQIEKFYSVAQHSMNCVDYARKHTDASRYDLRDIFCHDFTEAYIGDMVKPLKNLMPEFQVVEKRISDLLESKFRVCLSNPLIKKVDKILLFAERDVLFGKDDYVWNEEDNTPEYKLDLVFLDIKTVRKLFINMAEELNIG